MIAVKLFSKIAFSKTMLNKNSITTQNHFISNKFMCQVPVAQSHNLKVLSAAPEINLVLCQSTSIDHTAPQ